MKQDIKEVVTQRPGVKQVVTQKLGFVEQEVNQIGTQKPGLAPRDLQEEDNETGTSIRAKHLLPQVYTVEEGLQKQRKCYKKVKTSGNQQVLAGSYS